MTQSCPFCALPVERVVFQNDHAIAVRDGYPISPGHSLVMPLRHVASLFDTSPTEREAMFDLVFKLKKTLDVEFGPAGYNVGVNDGAAAGQTIGHLHIHLIPRFPGDIQDPRGGVRWVIPAKADYWTRRT